MPFATVVRCITNAPITRSQSVFDHISINKDRSDCIYAVQFKYFWSLFQNNCIRFQLQLWNYLSQCLKIVYHYGMSARLSCYSIYNILESTSRQHCGCSLYRSKYYFFYYNTKVWSCGKWMMRPTTVQFETEFSQNPLWSSFKSAGWLEVTHRV